MLKLSDKEISFQNCHATKRRFSLRNMRNTHHSILRTCSEPQRTRSPDKSRRWKRRPKSTSHLDPKKHPSCRCRSWEWPLKKNGLLQYFQTRSQSSSILCMGVNHLLRGEMIISLANEELEIWPPTCKYLSWRSNKEVSPVEYYPVLRSWVRSKNCHNGLKMKPTGSENNNWTQSSILKRSFGEKFQLTLMPIRMVAMIPRMGWAFWGRVTTWRTVALQEGLVSDIEKKTLSIQNLHELSFQVSVAPDNHLPLDIHPRELWL